MCYARYIYSPACALAAYVRYVFASWYLTVIEAHLRATKFPASYQISAPVFTCTSVCVPATSNNMYTRYQYQQFLFTVSYHGSDHRQTPKRLVGGRGYLQGFSFGFRRRAAGANERSFVARAQAAASRNFSTHHVNRNDRRFRFCL